MRVSLAVRELHPRRAFRIARVRRNPVRNVYIQVEHEGVTGLGEASPNAFYDETAEGVVERLRNAAGQIRELRIKSPEDIAAAWESLWPHLQPSRAAQCAVDLALWDWLGKRQCVPVTTLAWGDAPKLVTSFCTIGLSTPEELDEKIEELRGFPAVKIKSDATAELTVVRAVRERIDPPLVAVDANCAWADQDLGALSVALKALGVAFIEQPLPPALDETFHASASALPVMADESCVREEDAARAAGRFAGFNIKLVKCGGLTPGLRMARYGSGAGVKTMVGCMLESSALIAAGAVVAQATDFADLDGAWLLGDDPVVGWKFDRGLLLPPSEPGLGITLGKELAEAEWETV